MPDNIVWESVDTIARSFRHLGESFGFCLVFKGVAGKVDTGTMNVRLDDDVYTADAVEGYFLVFIFAPVAHFSHVAALSRVLLVAWTKSL
jgi:hypothetical protein